LGRKCRCQRQRNFNLLKKTAGAETIEVVWFTGADIRAFGAGKYLSGAEMMDLEDDVERFEW